MTIKNHHTRKVFAHNLKQLRKDAKLSQTAAAKKIGLKQNTWSQYESSKSFPEDIVLEKIVEMLSCTKEDLLEGDDNYELYPLENDANEPNELHSYGAVNKDLLGYLRFLDMDNRIDKEALNKIREYILELYKELSDQKDLLIKEKTKLEEFKEMMKDQI